MIDLYDSNITDILPEVLAGKPEVQALGYAIGRAVNRFLSCCQNISIYAAIDMVPENVLDLLAIELNTQYYDSAMDIATKRTLIRNTLLWYMTTGTSAAIEELAVAVFGDGQVREWFDYDGDPYCFQIVTSNLNSTDEMIQRVTDLVSTMQNVRSHLDAVIVEAMRQMQMYAGCVVECIGDAITIGIDMDI